jgi:hypothetical protein
MSALDSLFSPIATFCGAFSLVTDAPLSNVASERRKCVALKPRYHGAPTRFYWSARDAVRFRRTTTQLPRKEWHARHRLFVPHEASALSDSQEAWLKGRTVTCHDCLAATSNQGLTRSVCVS